MSFGLLALLAAGLSAGWLLWRVASGHTQEGAKAGARNVTVLKAVVWLGLAAVLFAAKLWPLAFMVLVAAGGVMAIESWRDKHIADDGRETSAPPISQKALSLDEAMAILGVSQDANADDIKAAHKRLIAQTHPDKGGTDYLAAKINDARDLLLRHKGIE